SSWPVATSQRQTSGLGIPPPTGEGTRAVINVLPSGLKPSNRPTSGRLIHNGPIGQTQMTVAASAPASVGRRSLRSTICFGNNVMSRFRRHHPEHAAPASALAGAACSCNRADPVLRTDPRCGHLLGVELRLAQEQPDPAMVLVLLRQLLVD